MCWVMWLRHVLGHVLRHVLGHVVTSCAKSCARSCAESCARSCVKSCAVSVSCYFEVLISMAGGCSESVSRYIWICAHIQSCCYDTAMHRETIPSLQYFNNAL